MLITYYTKLGLAENATPDEIKRAYRKLVLMYHPDRQHLNPEETAAKFREIQRAYECLSDPSRRHKYDSDLWLFRNRQNPRNSYTKQSSSASANNGSAQSTDWNDSYEDITDKPTSSQASGGIFSLKWIYSFGAFIAVIIVIVLLSVNTSQPKKSSDVTSSSATGTINKSIPADPSNKINSLQKLRVTYHIHDSELLTIQRTINAAGGICDWEQILDAIEKGFTPQELINLWSNTQGGDKTSYKTHTSQIPAPPRIQSEKATSVPVLIPKASSSATLKTPSTIYAGNKLPTGSAPYRSYYGHLYKNESLSAITFINGQGLDAIVMLYDVNYKEIIRDVYICSGDSFTMEELPEGRYRIRIYSGKDWNPTQKAIPDGPLGRFDSSELFQTSTANNDFNIRFDYNKESISYPSYEVTLHKVINGNMHTKNISKSDFFKL